MGADRPDPVPIGQFIERVYGQAVKATAIKVFKCLVIFSDAKFCLTDRGVVSPAHNMLMLSYMSAPSNSRSRPENVFG